MNFDLSAKDVIYILVYVVSVVTIINSLKNSIKNLGKDIQSVKTEIGKDISLLKKVIFRQDGALNFITQDVFRESKNLIYEKIRSEATVTQKAFKSIDTLNENVLKIMIHMKIQPNGKEGL